MVLVIPTDNQYHFLVSGPERGHLLTTSTTEVSLEVNELFIFRDRGGRNNLNKLSACLKSSRKEN